MWILTITALYLQLCRSLLFSIYLWIFICFVGVTCAAVDLKGYIRSWAWFLCLHKAFCFSIIWSLPFVVSRTLNCEQIYEHTYLIYVLSSIIYTKLLSNLLKMFMYVTSKKSENHVLIKPCVCQYMVRWDMILFPIKKS